MADSAFKTQVSKDENANLATNPIFTQLTDGTSPLSVTGGVLDVNASVTPENVYVDDSAFVVGTDQVGATAFLADEVTPDSVDEGDIGIARMTLDRKQLMVITDPTTDANRLKVNANGSIDVNTGAIASSGTEVHDYDHAVATGSGASTNHDYTVANTTFLLSKVLISSSGKGRYEVQFGPIASLVTIAVGFLEKDSNSEIVFDPPLPVPVTGTGTLRVIKFNRQAAATDYYTTIMGEDI